MPGGYIGVGPAGTEYGSLARQQAGETREMRICERCEVGVLANPAIEYMGNDETVSIPTPFGPLTHAVVCEDQITCAHCGLPTAIRQGTAYWTDADWAAEEPPSILVWPDDLDADGRQLACGEASNYRLVNGQVIAP